MSRVGVDVMIRPLVLWLALVVPSLYVVQKFAGWAGVLGYLAAAWLGVAWRERIRLPGSARATRWAASATFVLVVTAFLVIYPIVNVQAPGHGSDDDDASNIGARALLARQSPYEHVTYLGNALHTLPGSFLLALPFVVLGTSAWQNLFWLTLFFLAVSRVVQSERAALRLAWLVLVFSPTVIHQVVTGTAYAANTIYVLLGLLWLIRTRHRRLAAIGWGVALASRANFLLLMPLAVGWIVARHGAREGVRAATLTGLTIVAISAPFYLHDPTRFGPLEGADRLLRFDAVVPYAGEFIVVLMAGVALVLAARPMSEATLFASCAMVQALPVLVGSMISSIYRRQLDLAYTVYATFAAWFLIMAIATSEKR